jgi:hypothetical protein
LRFSQIPKKAKLKWKRKKNTEKNWRKWPHRLALIIRRIFYAGVWFMNISDQVRCFKTSDSKHFSFLKVLCC